MNWNRIDSQHYRVRLDSGTYDARLIDGEWTLWVQPRLARGFIRKSGSWTHLAEVKQRATVLNNDVYLRQELAYRFAHQAETRQRILDEYEDCLCWVGHRGCGGCSGVIGITHEPSCGWEWNPDCPVHPPEWVVGREDHATSDVPDEWQGLPDYVLDDLESTT